MWYKESVFYQIYPLGFCNAPLENDGKEVNRIKKVCDWIKHMVKLNVNAIYFSPIFESDKHGYDTRDYSKIKMLSVRKLNERVPMRCIYVDTPSHLYLTDNYIVTHNTLSLSGAAIEGNFDSVIIMCLESIKTNWKNEL